MRNTIGAQHSDATRKAGIFLLITALATVVAVIGRVAADADQATLVQSLAAVSENRELYAIGGMARLISGITLVIAAWFLLQTWIIRERLATPLVPILFIASGIFTALSGASAVALSASGADTVTDFTEATSFVRWFTGKVGFTLAGLALMIAALYQWRVGGALRRIAPASAVIGVAMLLIWVDAATVLHPITGTAFFIWMLAVGAMLFTGRTDEHFARMSNEVDSSD